MNNNSVRVWDQKSAANVAIRRDIGACNCTPEPMLKHEKVAANLGENTGAIRVGLISTYRFQ